MWKTYKRLLGFASPFAKYAVPYFFYALLYALFNTLTYALIIPIMKTLFMDNFVFTPIYTPPMLSDIFAMRFDGAVSYLYTLTFGESFAMPKMLTLLACMVVLVTMLSSLFRYLSAMVVEQMRVRSVQRMRNDMFTRIMEMSAGYFSDKRKGDIISRITQDVMVVQHSITNTLQVIFRDPLLIIGYLVVMLGISWKLSLFAIIFLPLVALLIGRIVKKLRHPAIKGQERMGDMVSILDESLAGIKVIKTYNATGYIRRKFRDFNADFSHLMLSMARRQQLASPMSEFLGITAVAVLIVYGGSLVVGGSLRPEEFVAFIAAFSQITRPVRSFVDQFATLNQGIAAGERIFQVIDERPDIADVPGAMEMGEFKKSLEFRDVHFSYDGEREVIDGVSFTVPHGQTVALVGPSGGGKSTLSELIPRFYDPTSGEILVDGVPLQDLTQKSLRDHISTVAQDTVLFNDTIAGNIAMGCPGASLDEIITAAKVANAHTFIMETPQGYDTNIGDRGTKLSGGQRQRLSIARAVLKNPEILILDEATSALDTESEKLVQEALNSLLKGRTSVVIAHRLSTIHNADKILVVDKGRIIEQGTHTELIALNGTYAKLIEMQAL